MRAMGHRNISKTIGYIDALDDMLRRAVTLVRGTDGVARHFMTWV